jgi:uncharacterized protein YegP (UPF0339 family)
MAVNLKFFPKLEIKKDSKSEWRWSIKVNSGIIEASTEGYKNRKDCVDNLLNVEDRMLHSRF